MNRGATLRPEFFLYHGQMHAVKRRGIMWAFEKDDDVVVRIVVQPRAKRTGVVGVHGDALKVRIQAPPVDGAANKALIAFLATQLDLPRSALTLQSGHASRRKTVLIRGLSLQQIVECLTG